ncbi:putative disease resistance RPP13-like protein 1 [Hevea brasiliensis]|uniref:putative disease resistance RPP13-like protein 1 n=1 Tax=Hevea brasiliensis TaxID=3981 RepID=UPI0025F90E9B|nr:putative disease resistance RPP13-like protein 1 [Hevea brasiliensis]XP_021680448.2 putative disease resistance RPP13-like protein 1 [Hevea brasiliensis]XP_021680450.2 putative disease resistance RPP13-like protein 1 [Hevea brasiliensis]XP_021680451.2 putative disease resistance RPP13-like protein 1 [Hevea brasiliensis]XP_057994512.1 putative disease resistance RPP13-like protein 1 [Hevea brasiliensis]XP_057994513.1 putative disease resistance RPP13-like protein 1 [Hevea brasiliensis]XP_05
MSGIGEAALSAFMQVLFQKLASPDLLNFARQKPVHSEIKKWEKMLQEIRAVLDDAEDKQMTNQSLRIWLSDLKDLAYDVEDVLDEFATESLRRRLVGDTEANTCKLPKFFSTSCTCTCFNPRYAMFNSKVTSKIKEITTRLEDVEMRRNKLGLRENVVGVTSSRVWQRPPSTCLQDEPQVYGRDEDKNKMLELLLRDETSNAKIGVIPIVGMGGVGKTTLARLVYNDKTLQNFHPKAWVCVSDEFDIMRITKGILESITSQPCDLNEFNEVQLKLHKELSGKKFLIILDDVWNENYVNWNNLRSPFMDGAWGSKIVVTTRSIATAQMMGTVECHNLRRISDDDCWLVFSRHAFENRSTSVHPNLEIIGRKIVKYRCGGLPLAARTLGGLLRSKQREDEWEDVLNSKIWTLQGENSDILPVLRLSYHHLPSHLKRCFAYCAIIPKDYEFEEKELVLLWMAEGLIQQQDDKKHMEDFGSEYFRDLLSRSIFQASDTNESRFVMHNLVSDLAQKVAEGTCFRLEDEPIVAEQYKIERARHCSYIRGYCDGIKRFESFYRIKSLRTFLPLSLRRGLESFVANNVPSELLSELRSLRVLSFSGYNITELPDSIGDLKLLRYLDLSNTKIRSLPESTTSLYNLQTLMLKECSLLRKLPSRMENLINLLHLDIVGVKLAEGMPSGVKELKSLRTLFDFSVSKDNGAGITALMNLNFLQGALRILDLENVTNAQDARESKLTDKNLDALFLKWGYKNDDARDEILERDVLDGLQPQANLKRLSISSYWGTRFPSWIGDPSFHNLVLLRLENCKKCISLPRLGTLPSLKDLVIIGMSGIKRVDREFYGEGFSTPFPVLETLCFWNMHEWEEWDPCGVEFPSLRELSIEYCPKLLGELPRCLSSLKKLVIRGCLQLVVSLPSLSKASELEIERCKEVDCRYVVDFGSLKSMVLSEISTLTSVTEWFTQGLKRVKELKVSGDIFPSSLQVNSNAAEEEEQLVQQGPADSQLEILTLTDCENFPQWLHNLVSLRELIIEDSPRIVSFPKAGFPSMLRVIGISNCNAITSLPDAVIDSKFLEHLEIESCDSLVSLGRGQLPPTLKRLQIISCKSLQNLLGAGYCSSLSSSKRPKDEMNVGCSKNTFILEFLSVDYCPSLTSLGELPDSLQHLDIGYCSEIISLSSGGNLPASLKFLKISFCSKLESIAERFDNTTFLEYIEISNCNDLVSLPDGLHKLINLHEISIINLPALVFFPWGGLPTTYLKNFRVEGCEKLQSLPDSVHNLTTLQELVIHDCPCIESLPEEGLPIKLNSLWVCNLKLSKSLFAWGLHRLTSLRSLCIEGGCPDVVSFPNDETGMLLPSSLVDLAIKDLPNLKYLSTNGFQNLATLQVLCVRNCPKLAFFPKKGLPLSLLQLYIFDCPLLKQRCQKDKGQEWTKIAHIPRVQIDWRSAFEPEDEARS